MDTSKSAEQLTHRSNDELERLRAEVEHLQRALQSRTVIGQATGIVMATMHCGADEAFRVLVAQSQFQNRKLVDIAQELVGNSNSRSRRSGSSSLQRS